MHSSFQVQTNRLQLWQAFIRRKIAARSVKLSSQATELNQLQMRTSLLTKRTIFKCFKQIGSRRCLKVRKIIRIWVKSELIAQTYLTTNRRVHCLEKTMRSSLNLFSNANQFSLKRAEIKLRCLRIFFLKTLLHLFLNL